MNTKTAVRFLNLLASWWPPNATLDIQDGVVVFRDGDTDETHKFRIPVDKIKNIPFGLIRPLPRGIGYVTQLWGVRPEYYSQWAGFWGHEGIDWGIPVGTPVLAAADGTVYQIATDPNTTHAYGICVRLKHQVGAQVYRTAYAHLSRITVAIGEEIKTGEEIGLSGSTGNSSGPHLHFSLKRDGETERAKREGRSPVWAYDLIDPTEFFIEEL